MVNTCDGKPYCVQSIFQSLFLRLLSNKPLHDCQFLIAPSLESARIVKNESVMIGEPEFMFDAVLATLVHDQKRPKRSTGVTDVHGWVKLSLRESKTNGIATRRLECLPCLGRTPRRCSIISGKRLDSS